MNGYDFDGTIYRGDSTRDFLIWCFRKEPKLLRFLPGQIAAFALYGLGRLSKTELKERVYRMLSGCNAEMLAEAFWDTHSGRICSWYLRQKQDTDMILSASPEFLLRPICLRLGIRNLIASRVDPTTGKYRGVNCFGKEKAKRLADEYGINRLDAFYSDSQSDAPVAELADRAYLIQKGIPVEIKEKAQWTR